MKYDGIIFDLDGTLWDSRACIADSWSATVAACGGVTRFTLEDIAAIMGLPEADIADRAFYEFGERRREICRRSLVEEVDYLKTHKGIIYDGVGDMLAALSQQLPLFIVSNCQAGYIESFLCQSGYAPYITDFESEGASGLKKAVNIRRIAERYALHAPVYVGDTALDERSAREAGCAFIHAAYGFGSAVEPDGSICTPSALVRLLGKTEVFA